MKNMATEGQDIIQNTQNDLEKYEVRSRLRPNDSREAVSPKSDFGLFNQYKLEDLINVQSDGFKEGCLVRVAFIENHSLHLEEEAIELFEQYAKQDIALTAIYGAAGAGKSLLLDKIINLTEVEGSHFMQVRQPSKSIYMWSIPFSRGGTKVFLLDIDGDDTDSDDYHLLLSFLLFLASNLVILAAPNDLAFQALATLTKQLKKCRKSFGSKIETDVEEIWPSSVCCLFRSSITDSKTIKSLRKMFIRFSWKTVGNARDERQGQGMPEQDLKNVPMLKYAARKKILSEGYLKSISAVFRYIHAKIESKTLSTLRFTGANLVKLAVNAVQSLNVKGELNLDRIARRSLKELYEQAYEYHTLLYNEQLAGFLADQRPFQMDYLIAAFKDSHQIVFKSFKGLNTNPELAQVYSDKLQRYVAEKQRMILAINKKKCASEAKMVVPAVKPVQQIKEFIQEAKQSPKCLEQVYVSEMATIIATAFKQVETQRKNLGDKGKQTKLKSESIEFKIHEKQSELHELKQNNIKKESVVKESQMKKQFLDSKQKKLNEVLKKLKTQISQAKSVQPADKLKDSEKLRLEEEQLRKELKAKQRTIVQLRSQREVPQQSHEQIELLASQIEQKVMKTRELESALASHIPKLQSIQTFRSNSKISTPRKVQSRAFKSESPQIRIISSPKV